MRYEEMEALIEEEVRQIRQLRATKGLEYASEEDTLADFKEVAVEAGTTPLQVWLTYVKKHQRAIDTYIREGGVRSESIESRIRDVIVYHFLLLGLIQDERPNVQAADPPDANPPPSSDPCGAWHRLSGEGVDRLHQGEFIRCELSRGHHGVGTVQHYGRTHLGHGFAFADSEVCVPPATKEETGNIDESGGDPF